MVEISTYTEKYNDFARQLLWKYYEENNDQNIVMSPFSVLTLLVIAADATAGETRNEVLKALSEDLENDDIISLICKIQSVLTEGHALSSANAVCVQHSIKDTITPDYPDFLQTQFGGEFFSSPDIVSAVNTWVKKSTNGLIDKTADESMRDMLACLINATAFEGYLFRAFLRRRSV